jgi:hypothetical protein
VGSPGRSAGATGARVSTFQGVAFVLGQSTPDSRVMAGLHGPGQAGHHALTAAADDFCLFRLQKRGVAVPDREEQLGVLVQTGSAIAPCHEDCAPTEVMGFGIVLGSSGCASLGVTVFRSLVVQVWTSGRAEPLDEPPESACCRGMRIGAR